MVNKTKGLTRIINAAGYSLKGYVSAFKNEAAFRQELAAAVVLIPIAFFVDVSKIERIMMVSVVILVLIVELLNTGIEAVVDRVGTEHHELAGMAKDTGSAAVFTSLLLWGYVWGSVLFL